MGVKKRTRLLAFVFLCMIFVCACSNKVDKDGNKGGGSITETPSVLTTPTTGIEPTIEELNEFRELSIYTIDSETAEKIALTAVVSADREITPQLIVDKVVESMADQAFMIGIDSVTTQDDAIIVSFLDNQPPVMNVGSSVEGEILDAIAQSLLDNLEGEYHKVIYRVMGEAYVSGHFAFDIDHVYLESQ
jgi:hypothetical protein